MVVCKIHLLRKGALEQDFCCKERLVMVRGPFGPLLLASFSVCWSEDLRKSF